MNNYKPKTRHLNRAQMLDKMASLPRRFPKPCPALQPVLKISTAEELQAATSLDQEDRHDAYSDLSFNEQDRFCDMAKTSW